jgi:hypothetical protein
MSNPASTCSADAYAGELVGQATLLAWLSKEETDHLASGIRPLRVSV